MNVKINVRSKANFDIWNIQIMIKNEPVCKWKEQRPENIEDNAEREKLIEN